MKPFYSMRLGEIHELDRDLLAEFVSMFRRNPGSCDEVWFATYYGYPPVDKHFRLADKITAGAEYVRSNGIAASLQVSNTLGHGSSNSVRDFSGMSWDDTVGPDGTHAVYSSCPRDPRFLEYLSVTMRRYAEMKPDVVWIDDDLRMHNHRPVDFGCFCPRCVEAFNEANGTNYDREGLVLAANSQESPAVRDRLVQHNQASLMLVASAVADAVMEVSPESTVGIQQASFAWSSYSGGTFKPLYDGLARITGRPSACRPGGGHYTDHAPRGVLNKALHLNLQIQRTPEAIDVAQAEIENIPHNVAGKSVRGTQIESAVHLAFGCTSLSYSAFMIPNEPPSFYEPLFAGLASWRTFLTDYAKFNEGAVCSGAGIAFSETHRKLDMTGKPGFAWASFGGNEVSNLLVCGLPLTWRNEQTPATVLHHTAVDGMSDTEIEDVFSGGVLTDGQTVERLNARGLGGILDLDVEHFDEMKSVERCTDHPVSGPYAGQIWYHYYTPMSPTPPLKLVPQTDRAEIVGRYVSADEENPAETGISGVLTETSLGGRAAVFGYNPWSNLINSAKRHQILNAADWVCGDGMPVYCETPAQVALVPRVDGTGALVSVFVLNVAMDDAPELRLSLRGCRGNRLRWATPEGADERIVPETAGSAGSATAPAHNASAPTGSAGTVTVVVPSLAAWSFGVIRVEVSEGGRA